jgi:restriction endonuclease Mrr
MMGEQRPGGGFEGPPTTAQEREAAPTDLTWQEFEDRVAQLFHTVGFRNVRLTPRQRNGGKDIVMEVPDPLRENRVICVECKHWRANSVGRREVRLLHSLVVGDPNVARGVIVTTGTFSSQAVAYAKRVGLIDLIHGKTLREMMAKAGIRLE